MFAFENYGIELEEDDTTGGLIVSYLSPMKLNSHGNQLKEGDILLVAGKGHEKYQEIAGRKYFFSDQELIKKYMQ